MSSTQKIEPGQSIDLTGQLIGVERTDRRAGLVEQVSGQPPQRIDGVTIGAPFLTGDAPHNGEMHPDGDEVLFLVSGALTVHL